MPDREFNINQAGEGNTQNNFFGSLPQMEGNPFKPPSPREGGFFGRQEDLHELHNLLQSDKNVCVVVGMGGVGKTELVRNYADSEVCQTEFVGGVFYMDVRDRQDLALEIVALTKWKFKRDLDPSFSDAQKVTACWQMWETQNQKVLLILDDVAKLSENAKYFLLPKDMEMVRVLMTSREVPDRKVAEKLELKVLTPEAARLFLASIIGQKRIDCELKEANLLCQDLGYLPLALELVGYYLIDEDYLNLPLGEMRAKLANKVKHPSLSPEDMPLGMTASRGVIAAFDLSWEELNTEAKHLGCVFGIFGAGAIHWDFVNSIYRLLQGEAFSADDLKDRWLKTLRKLHLVLDVDKDIYNLHPLVRDYFDVQLQIHPERSQIEEVFCDVFINVAKDVEISSSLQTFNLIEPHLKKTISFLDRNQDARLAYSLNQLATLYYSQGRYSEAEPLYLRSLQIKEQQLGADHPSTATSLNNLAGLYYSQGRYSEAEPLYSQALQILEKILGKDHPKTIATRDNYAQCLKQIASLSK